MPTDNQLDAAVQDSWRRDSDPPGGMVTRWVLVAECLDAEGNRAIDYWWSDGLLRWDLKGLLHHALDDQITGAVAELVNDED